MRCSTSPRRCATPRDPRHPRRRQHRHRRQRPRPADGRAGARRRSCHPGLRFHFVSNVDGHDIARGAAPARSGEDAVHRRQQDLHDAGDDGQRADRARLVRRAAAAPTSRSTSSPRRPTSRPRRSSASRRTFGFWDWVGGRYSLWSAIGLPIALAVGAEHFRALLAGAHAMDRHFATAPPAAQPAGAARPGRRLVPQLPSASRAAASRPITRACSACRPTCSSSRWKATASGSTQDGEPLPFATSPVVWGEPGTNAQHAYFQMLHQGTDTIPVEFILVRAAGMRSAAHSARSSSTSTACCWRTAWPRRRR